MTGERSPYSGRAVADYMDGDYTLHDVEGDKVGKIVEFNEDFIVVERGGGFLGLGEKQYLYVPRSEIGREEGDDWYLNIDEDQIDTMGWSDRPTGADWTERGEYAERPTDAGGADTRQGARLVRYEEDLEPQKVARESGEVTVGKRLVEDTKTIDVPVRREEVHVERRPVSGDATVSDAEAFTEDRISVPVMEEDVEVRKVARPVEEVEITKTASQDTRRVEDTVRREELDVDDPTSRASSSGETGDEELR